MKALTVQQPWAWAIIHGGKTIENRTTYWSYRGPLAIHAGTRWSDRGGVSDQIADAWGEHLGFSVPVHPVARPDYFPRGVIIGAVDLVDVHWSHPHCCDGNPWAERSYVEHGGTERHEIVHLVLKNPHAITPIDIPGRLGLWNVPDDIAHLIERTTA